jgi:hypothetical protein
VVLFYSIFPRNRTKHIIASSCISNQLRDIANNDRILLHTCISNGNRFAFNRSIINKCIFLRCCGRRIVCEHFNFWFCNIYKMNAESITSISSLVECSFSGWDALLVSLPRQIISKQCQQAFRSENHRSFLDTTIQTEV